MGCPPDPRRIPGGDAPSARQCPLATSASTPAGALDLQIAQRVLPQVRQPVPPEARGGSSRRSADGLEASNVRRTSPSRSRRSPRGRGREAADEPFDRGDRRMDGPPIFRLTRNGRAISALILGPAVLGHDSAQSRRRRRQTASHRRRPTSAAFQIADREPDAESTVSGSVTAAPSPHGVRGGSRRRSWAVGVTSSGTTTRA